MSDDSKPGRRLVFQNVAELELKIKNYFDSQDPHTENKLVHTGENHKGEPMFDTKTVLSEQKPYTVTGLARALSVDRNTLRNYRNPNHYPDDIDPELRQGLISTIDDAFMRVEEYNEQNLHKSGLANGVKFNLVNNFNWQDKHVVDQTNREAKDALDSLDDQPAVQDGRDEIADAAANELNPPVDDPAPSEPPAPPAATPPAEIPPVTEPPVDDPGSPPQE